MVCSFLTCPISCSFLGTKWISRLFGFFYYTVVSALRQCNSTWQKYCCKDTFWILRAGKHSSTISLTLTIVVSFTVRVTAGGRKVPPTVSSLKGEMQVSFLNIHKIFTYYKRPTMYQLPPNSLLGTKKLFGGIILTSLCLGNLTRCLLVFVIADTESIWILQVLQADSTLLIHFFLFLLIDLSILKKQLFRL